MLNNETDILIRRSSNPEIIRSKVNVSLYKDIIENVSSDVEHVLIFNSGIKADFVESVKPYDSRFSNFLGLYYPDVHDAFIIVRDLVKDMCWKFDINYSKSSYYMSSDFMTLDNDHWYDGGGLRIPAFNGLIIVDSQPNTKLWVSETEIDVNPGDVLLFEAGHKVAFGNSNSLVISFNVAPLSMLNGQYPNKWIPL
jgi:hypothetical protein